MRRFFVLAFLVAAPWGASAAHADVIGDVETFSVNSEYDVDSADSIRATLRAAGTNGYFYVDDRYWNSLSGTERQSFMDGLLALSSDFDSAIYPRSTQLWGSEAKPGVDGDPRVTVLVEELKHGTGGYFQTIDNYPRAVAPDGNAREMVYITAPSVTNGTRARDFLAHEFQHLISFNQKELLRDAQEDLWLNESRSEYNVTNAGFSQPFTGSSPSRRTQSFENDPEDSLVEWPNTVTDYAIAALFAHYMTDRFGPSILADTLRTAEQGIPALDAWLASRGVVTRFRDIFGDWMAAVALGSRAGAIGYTTDVLDTISIPPTDTASLDSGERIIWQQAAKDWEPAWLRLDVSGADEPAVIVDIDGKGSDLFSGTLVADYGGSIQVSPWSMSGDTTSFAIPTQSGGLSLDSLVVTLTQGRSTRYFSDDQLAAIPVTVTAKLGDGSAIATPTATPAPATGLKDGDLIRKGTEKEVYVIWGSHKRLMVPGTLELYGFQDRPVASVTAEVFNGFVTSNYIRQANTEPAYAVWPDGTKHHLAITAAQWDASGRNWNSIFIINEREAAFYATGEPITR